MGSRKDDQKITVAKAREMVRRPGVLQEELRYLLYSGVAIVGEGADEVRKEAERLLATTPSYAHHQQQTTLKLAT